MLGGLQVAFLVPFGWVYPAVVVGVGGVEVGGG
jgi:hypothetical protein